MRLRSSLFALVSVSMLSLTACGSSDDGDGTQPAADDSGAVDSVADSVVADSTMPDTTVPDTTVPDSAATADSGADSSAGDSRSDSDSDSGSDAAIDGGVACKTYDDTTDGTAKILGVFTLPASTSLAAIDPLLSAGDLSSAAANGALATDPGPGSGLDYAGGCSFYMVGDRGPNGDHTAPSEAGAGSVDGKTFPATEYTPAVVKVSLDSTTNAIIIDSATPLVDTAGNPVTGLPNGPADSSGYYDRAFTSASATMPMVFDTVNGGFHIGSRYVSGGLDTEDIRRLPSGDFAVVEEYSPSIAIVDHVTGKVKVRYTPKGVTIPNAGYAVKSVLPAVFTNRRINKGFEGLAISKDGKFAYLVLQAPMGSDSDAKYAASLVNRVLKLDITDPLDAKVVGQYLVLHGTSASFGGKAKDQSKVYFNSATWLADDHLLFIDRVAGHFQLIDVDLAHNGAQTPSLILEGTPAGDTIAPEDVSAGYSTMGLVPAGTTVVFDSADLSPSLFVTDPTSGKPSPDKIEGVTVINKATVAIANDNDFGIGSNPNEASKIWVLRLKSPLTLAP